MAMSDEDRHILSTMQQHDHRVRVHELAILDLNYKIEQTSFLLQMLSKGYRPNEVVPHTLETRDQLTHRLSHQLSDWKEQKATFEKELVVFIEERDAFEDAHPRHSL